ncbi:MAG TPA: HD domain-containing protein [Patescibacteria group bacterium]|nr:HD domain-containing protein [Patescibacteria group bacterium]
MDEKILFLIQQAGTLMNMPRSHKKHLGTAFDTVASHSFHVAVIAYCVARMERLDNEAAAKAALMGLFHDLVEARTGDVDFVGKHYTTTDEKQAVKDQFDIKDFGKDLVGLIEDFEDRTSLEAKCAKDADSLEQLYQEWVLSWQGNKLANKWFESDFKDRVPGLRTESAKMLANKMKDSNPQEWWWSQFVKDDMAIDREKLLGKK